MIKQYIVTKEILNIRSKPTEDSEYKGELKLNTTVWLDDIEIIGATPTGGLTNIWLIFNSNLFVSKDGLEISSKTEFITALKEYWKSSQGEGVTIALLDSGVEQHSSLTTKLNHEDFVKDNKIFTPHGTRMAGIIAGNNRFSFTGIAPEANIFSCRIIAGVGNENINPNHLINALNKVKTIDNISVVNLSIEYTSNKTKSVGIGEAEKKRVSELIDELIANGKIVCAATGNFKGHLNFPGSLDSVITVGAMLSGVHNYPNGLDENSAKKSMGIECFIDFFEWSYCNVNNLIVKNDRAFKSSEATALLSALICLKKRKNVGLNQTAVKKLIKDNSISSTKVNGLIINKLNMSNFLKA